MRKERVAGLALYVGLLLSVLFSSAFARTVLLVYDDSGSMVEDGVRYHEFANYATQNLAALLSPGDRLEVVRLSRPEEVVTLLPERATADAIDTVASWVAAGSTPYVAVQTAMARLREMASQRPADDDESYWLIVFSDGAFDRFRDDVQEGIDTVPGDVRALRRDFADRRLGIVYLGIGARADTYAEPWRRAGVLSLTAPDAPTVAEALFDIAAVITERDPAGQGLGDGLTARRGDGPGTVAVESELPLARLATFYQSDRPVDHGIDAAGSTLRTSDGTAVDLQTGGPYVTAGGGLHGVVNVIEADETFRVLRPGTFELALSGPGANDVDPGRLRVLPEVALDLAVTAETTGVVCAGEAVQLLATLQDPDRTEAVPLGSLRGLRIEATVDAPGSAPRQVPFEVRADRAVAEVVPAAGTSVVSVSARYPGYFNLRSRIVTIEARECVEDLAVTVEPATFAMPPTLAGTPEPVATASLRVGPPASLAAWGDRRVHVLVEGLPEGIEIGIGDARLASGQDVAEIALPADGTAMLEVLHSRAFAAGDPDARQAVLRIAPADAGVPVRFARDTQTLTFAYDRPSLSFERADGQSGPLRADVLPPSGEGGTIASFLVRIAVEEGAVPPDAGYRVRATGAPEALFLTLAGERLPADGEVRATFPVEEDLVLEVLAGQGFRLQDVIEVDVAIASSIVPVTWRSDTLRLQLAPVIGDGRVSLDADAVDVPFVSSGGFQPVATLEATFDVEGVPRQAAGPIELRVDGLPEGLAIDVEGSRLTSETPSTRLATVPDRAEFTVLHDERFSASEPAVVDISVTSDGRAATWSPARLRVRPVARTPGLELVDPDVAIPLDELRSTSFAATPYADVEDGPDDRVEASPADLVAWELATVQAPRFLRAEAVPDPDASLVRLRLAPVHPALRWLAPTGAVSVELRIENGRTGENAVVMLQPRVGAVGFWDATGPFLRMLAAILVVLVLVAWLVAWIRKPKFPRRAGFRVHTEVPVKGKQGEEWNIRALSLGGRSLMPGSRLWPFGPQRAMIDGMTLRATAGKNVVLEADPGDGRVVERGPGRVPVHRDANLQIPPGEQLAVRSGNEDDTVTVYKYLTDLPRRL